VTGVIPAGAMLGEIGRKRGKDNGKYTQSSSMDSDKRRYNCGNLLNGIGLVFVGICCTGSDLRITG